MEAATVAGIGDLPLRRTLESSVGRVHVLEAGLQRLDGGAMFGVVPRPLWERRIRADERNRIPLAMRCLLVEHPDALVLIDTGAGNKEDEKFREIYGLENDGSPTRLEDAIRDAGHSPDDVTLVIDTHLHFDHAGGNTWRSPDGAIEPAFPRARYVVQRGEWEFAHMNNERIRASYLPLNFDPVADRGLFDFVEGETELLPGIRMVPTPGHTPHHQSVLIGEGDGALFFLADLVPTTAHLPLPWIMGYDIEPLVTLETKRRVLTRARDEQWLLVFEHDPVRPWGRLDPAEEKRPVLLPD
ncbi:MAG TPA: MBL fold metallo-hydrolase [Longimicrobiales bacterium]|nr:MBL fold metallo-hydrolase [Longimicrobiales bacterium]